MLAAVVGTESGDVGNEWRDDVGVLGRGDERGGGASGNGERRAELSSLLRKNFPQQRGLVCRVNATQPADIDS
jgi:hypothetical protein